MSEAPDLYVNSTVDPVTHDVHAFEGLVGSHGGLGGWQDQAVLLGPVDLMSGQPEHIEGADRLHRVLVGMLEQCGQRSRRSRTGRARWSGMGDWTLPAMVGALLFLANLTVKVVALGVIPANRKPSTGMAWLLLVLLNTGLGLVAFALFGSPRLDRRRQARQDQAKQRIRERTEEMADVPLDPALPRTSGRWSR